MNSKFLLPVIFLVILSSCVIPKPSRKNEIKKVVFATGGCTKECPMFAISVDSALNYKFHGVKQVLPIGYFTGKIIQEFWDSLNIKLETVQYKLLQPLYTDDEWANRDEIVIYFNDTVKSVLGQSTVLPESVAKVFSWIKNSYRRVNLNKSDSIAFETWVDKIFPPVMETVKFVPPVVYTTQY